MKKLGILAVLSILVSSLVLAQSDGDNPFTADQERCISQSVVQLQVQTADGTARRASGVVVDSEGIIFTNAHVVESAFEIQVWVYEQTDLPPVFAYFATPQLLSEDLDFAVIEIVADAQGNPIDKENLDFPCMLPWNRTPLARYTPIYIVGYPDIGGGRLTSTAGIVSTPLRQPGINGQDIILYETDAIFADGASGGLVVNISGEYIGIPSDWRTDSEGTGQLTYFIPLSTVCEIEPDVCEYEPGPIPISPTPNAGISTEEGITGQELQRMLNDNPDVQEMINALDVYYETGSNWQKGGDWGDDGISLNGPVVFWTNLFNDAYNLPQGVTPIRTTGGWGVFRVNVGTRYAMPSSSVGGRYLRIVDDYEPPVQTAPDGIMEQELQQLLSENPDVQEMINALDIFYETGSNWQKGGDWGTAGITIDGPAVFWTNIFDDVYNLPPGVVPIRATGGWGVFKVNVGTRYIMPSSSVGGRYLRIITE